MWQKCKNIYHLLRALLSSMYFGFPSKDMVVIGVTGTDGKTTTSHLIYHILKKEGFNVALISTVSAIIGEKEYDTGFHVTTPDSFQIQKYILNAKKARCEYLVLEVTSHALDQNRVFGIHFNIGVLTNISHEHMDYHGTYDSYVKSKFVLLAKAESVVVNKDDTSYSHLLSLKKNLSKQQWLTYGFTDADLVLHDAPFVKNLTGEYNWSNALAALSVGKLLGVSLEEMKQAILSFTLPKGRLEKVYDKEFKVIIDFAHTPNSIIQVLKTIKKQTKGRVIHVFGAAGQRDASKRPLMGKASSDGADLSILTAEDPRGENASEICNQIKSGMSKQKSDAVIIAYDRQEAIKVAIDMAQAGDSVVITGKGHEQSMNLGQGEIQWSDFEAVEKAVKNI